MAIEKLSFKEAFFIKFVLLTISHFEFIKQKQELDKRLTDHNAGNLKYYTIAEVKKFVRKALKNNSNKRTLK